MAKENNAEPLEQPTKISKRGRAWRFTKGVFTGALVLGCAAGAVVTGVGVVSLLASGAGLLAAGGAAAASYVLVKATKHFKDSSKKNFSEALSGVKKDIPKKKTDTNAKKWGSKLWGYCKAAVCYGAAIACGVACVGLAFTSIGLLTSGVGLASAAIPAVTALAVGKVAAKLKKFGDNFVSNTKQPSNQQQTSKEEILPNNQINNKTQNQSLEQQKTQEANLASNSKQNGQLNQQEDGPRQNKDSVSYHSQSDKIDLQSHSLDQRTNVRKNDNLKKEASEIKDKAESLKNKLEQKGSNNYNHKPLSPTNSKKQTLIK